MSLVINTNIDALTAYRNLQSTQNSLSTSIERLSSGLRINKAADDAAGLAVSQGLTRQIGGIGQALRNAQDGINVVQTADGALNEVSTILQRLNVLAVQSANASYNDAARAGIQSEVTADLAEITRIANFTDFNGVSLLDGSFTSKTFQVGYQAAAKITVNVTQDGTAAGAGFTSTALGVSGVDLGSQSAAITALATISTAISTVAKARAALGALQNRFQHTINNLSVTQTNLQASNSSVLDADMATEVSNFTRAQILQQAGTSMLKQANTASQSVLSLLQ